MYGMYKQTVDMYNQSSSCTANLHNSFMVTPQNLTWSPVPSGQLIINVRVGGNALLNVGNAGGQLVGGVITRVVGLQCELLLEKAQFYLNQSVPKKSINVSMQQVCYS